MVIEKVIELVMNFMSEMHNVKNLSDIDFKKFENLGYTNSEISTAISWLVDERADFLKSNKERVSNPNAFRILSSFEEELFTKEAWGEVIQMNALGLINNQTLEMLLERVTMNGLQKVDVKLVHYFIAYHIFDVNSVGRPNNKHLLAGNETIN